MNRHKNWNINSRCRRFKRKFFYFIARLRSFLKCKTILILIQSTSSPLELAMGSWVLRLVDVFPSAAPRKHEHTGRAGRGNFAADWYTTESSDTDIHDQETSAGAIICFINLTTCSLTQSSASPTLYFIMIMQTPSVCALILFLRRPRKVWFSFGKTVILHFYMK